MTAIRFRPIEPHDGPALAALIDATPSTSAISFSDSYRADLIETNKAFATDFYAIAAMAGTEIVGLAMGDRSPIQLEGKVRDAIYLSNLRVRPDFRKKGIARGLSDYGVAYAERILGADPILYGAIMEGNISMALTKYYGFQLTKPIQGGIVPMRRSPPYVKPGLVVRAACENDLEEIADGMNAFYRKHNLWSPVTPDFLRNFLGKEVAGIHPNNLYVVTRGGRLVGGLSCSDRSRLVRMKLSNTPYYLRMLGGLLGVLPKSGILHALTMRRIWFKPGELAAARYLWQSLRYRLRQQSNSLGIAYDPQDTIANVFQIPFWLPMFKGYYVVKTNSPFNAERLIYCTAGP